MDEEVPDLGDAMGKVGPGRKALQHVPDPVGIASDSLLETVGLLVNFIYHSFSHRVISTGVRSLLPPFSTLDIFGQGYDFTPYKTQT